MRVEYDNWPTKLMGATGPKRRQDANGTTPNSSSKDRTVRRVNGSAAGASSNGRATGTASSERQHGKQGERQMIKRVFDIPSDFAASRDVQAHIMNDVIAAGFDEESVFAIRISLEEAIVNAIRHGNRLDASKRVKVESSTAPGYVEVMVEDEGAGFDRKGVPDPTATENLCRPSGRGILLIESYMTSVNWEKGGRRMRMVRQK